MLYFPGGEIAHRLVDVVHFNIYYVYVINIWRKFRCNIKAKNGEVDGNLQISHRAVLPKHKLLRVSTEIAILTMYFFGNFFQQIPSRDTHALMMG